MDGWRGFHAALVVATLICPRLAAAEPVQWLIAEADGERAQIPVPPGFGIESEQRHRDGKDAVVFFRADAEPPGIAKQAFPEDLRRHEWVVNVTRHTEMTARTMARDLARAIAALSLQNRCEGPGVDLEESTEPFGAATVTFTATCVMPPTASQPSYVVTGKLIKGRSMVVVFATSVPAPPAGAVRHDRAQTAGHRDIEALLRSVGTCGLCPADPAIRHLLLP